MSVQHLRKKTSTCHSRTYLATCALVVEGAERDGGQEDGDVEEDGRGHVLQQGFITANDTCGDTNTNNMSHIPPHNGAEEAQHFNFKPTETLSEFIVQCLDNTEHPACTVKLFPPFFKKKNTSNLSRLCAIHHFLRTVIAFIWNDG